MADERGLYVSRTWFQTMLILPFAVGFLVIGAISADHLSKESEWDKTAWYQLNTGCFVAAGLLAMNCLIIGCTGCDANNPAKPLELEKKKSFIRSMLFLGFVGLLISAVIVGNFIKESNVFEGCTYDLNNEYYFNRTSMDCFEEYSSIRILAAVDIIFLILSLIFIIEEIFKAEQYKKAMMASKNGAAQNELITTLFLKGLYFLVFSIAFLAVGGVATSTIKSESDGNQSYRLYLSAFLGAGVSVFLWIFFCYLHDKHQKGQKAIIQKIFNWLFPLMLLSFFVCIGGVVTVANFVSMHKDFVQCPNSTLFENKTIVFTCLENKDPLESCSVACVVLLVVSFLLIIGISLSHQPPKQSENSKVGNIAQKKNNPNATKSPSTQEEEERKKIEKEKKKKEEEEKKKKAAAEAAAKKQKDEEEAKKRQSTNNHDDNNKPTGIKVTLITVESEKDKEKKTENQSKRTELTLHVDFLNGNQNENGPRTTIQGAWGADTTINMETVNKNKQTTAEHTRREEYICKTPTQEELAIKKSTLYNTNEYWNEAVLPAPPVVVEASGNVNIRGPSAPPTYNDVIAEDKKSKQ